jgi:hypothetical protein
VGSEENRYGRATLLLEPDIDCLGEWEAPVSLCATAAATTSNQSRTPVVTLLEVPNRWQTRQSVL